MTTTYQLVNGLIEEVVDGVASGKFIEGPVSVAVSPTSQATFTQTYSTVSATVPADTYAATYAAPAVTSSAVATTGATNTTPYGFASAAQADNLIALANANKVDIAASNAKLAALAVDVAAVAADALATKKALGKVIDVLQSAGFAA